MAGTWESQNKVLPGAYINIRTNEPLSITPGDRGTVVILQEMSVGEDGQIYTITATEQAYPEKATAEDKKLATEALKKPRQYFFTSCRNRIIQRQLIQRWVSLKRYSSMCCVTHTIQSRKQHLPIRLPSLRGSKP